MTMVTTRAESPERQITAIVNSIRKEEYLKIFQKWIELMTLCIKYQENYFEHFIN